jgi:hypothetical protein
MATPYHLGTVDQVTYQDCMVKDCKVLDSNRYSVSASYCYYLYYCFIIYCF